MHKIELLIRPIVFCILLEGLPVLAQEGLSEGVSLTSEIDPPVFTDESIVAGFYGMTGSWGASWADFDNDGDLDVYTSAHGVQAKPSISQLWENNGDMTFSDVTAEKGINIQAKDRHGAMWADLNNDGYSELLIGIGGSKGEVWQNLAAEQFVNIGFSAGLQLATVARGVYAADYDIDGDLDVLSLGGLLWQGGVSNKFFRNEGNLQFTDISTEIGGDISLVEGNRVAAWADFNHDGLPDLLIMPPCTLYQNFGNGTFVDVTEYAGIAASLECQSPAWGDFDNDGDIDLYVTSGVTSATEQLTTAGVLYENNGDGSFVDITAQSGTSNPNNARAANWGDYDNDGWLDLYIVNGLNEAASNILFRNNGDGTFSDVSAQAGVGANVEGGGTDASFVDYNNDGFLDLFVTNGLGTRQGPYVLLKNSTNSNHWLKVWLQGINSNENGIMTKLTLTTNDHWMYREYNGNAHYFSQDDVPVHFGLGQDNAVHEIELTWPNGNKQRINNIASNQVLTVVEGREVVRGFPDSKQPDGYMIWLSGANWNIRWLGGENIRHVFKGKITTDGEFSAVQSFSFEKNDRLSWDSNQINFIAASKTGADTIRFSVTDASAVTFHLKQDGVARVDNIYIGQFGVKPASLPLTLAP